MDLLAERLSAVGVGRRDFLKIAGRPRRAGRRRLQRPAGRRRRPSSRPARSSPRSSTCGSAAAAGGRTTRPATTSTRTSTARGVPRAVGRPHEVQRRLPARALRGGEGLVQRRRLGVDLHTSARTPSGRTARRARPRTSSGRGSARWIRPARIRTRASSTTSRAPSPSTRARCRTPPGSAWWPRATGRWRSRWKGRAATSRCSPPTWPRCRPTSRRSRSTATSGRRPPTSSATGPFTLETWEHNKVMVLRKNKHFFGAKDVTLDKVTIPIIPVQSGALPYENNELDMTALQTGDLKRLRDDPRDRRARCSAIPFPGTWYLHPPGDQAAVRQRQGAARRGPRDRPRERGAGGRRLRHPRPLHDPARLPGRGGRQEDP